MYVCVRNAFLNIKSRKFDVYAVNFEGHFPVSPVCGWRYLLRPKPLSQIPPGLSEEGSLISSFRFSRHVSVEQK